MASKIFWIARTRVIRSCQREFWERETGGLAAPAKSISMRNSDHGDIQGKLAAALEGVVCRAWQRWKWTYQKPSWAVKGRFIPQHKWLPLGTCGILSARGKVLMFAVQWVWLALCLYMAHACSGRWCLRSVTKLCLVWRPFTTPEITQGLQDGVWKNHLAQQQ